MSKTILCAVDLGAEAGEAIRQAADAAAGSDAELVVFHAYEVLPMVSGTFPEYTPVQLDLLESAKRAAREALQATVTRMGLRVPVRVEVETALGAYAAIVERAEAVEAVLIVVGSRRAKAIDRLLLGSVAEKVVRYAHCPVLCARRSPAAGRVLVAADLSPASLAAITTGATEAQRRQVPLLVVHGLGAGRDLLESPQSRTAMRIQAEEQIQRWLMSADLRAEVVVEDGEPVFEVCRLAEQLPAQLVIVGATGRTGLKRVLLGSVAEGIVRKAPCSVLAVRVIRRASPGRQTP